MADKKTTHLEEVETNLSKDSAVPVVKPNPEIRFARTEDVRRGLAEAMRTYDDILEKLARS